MILSENEELLIKQMKLRAPILVIGAGFSYGIKNIRGEFIPKGNELAILLYKKLLASNGKIKREYLDEYAKHTDNLKDICDDLQVEELKKERNRLLLEVFSGCKCPHNDFHILLKRYPWRHIYSLNIDDLLENIYADEIRKGKAIVHIKQQSTIDVNATLNIYKLHGSVSRQDLGFVFDSEEYREYSSASSLALTSFGYQYMNNDVIFLGTEFQEDDLHLIIEKWGSMANHIHAPNYFFVSPSIKSKYLCRKIEKTNNMYYIPWTTQEFLETIKEKISIVDEERRKLRDYGMVFYNDLYQNETEMSSGYLPELYTGAQPRPIDFFLKYDIQRPRLANTARDIAAKNKNTVISLYGDSYVGKTCAALRLGVDLMQLGYEFSVYSLTYGMDARTYTKQIIEYVNSMPEGTRIAVMAENMPYYYRYVDKILRYFQNKQRIITFICTGSTEDHESKRYILDVLSQEVPDIYIGEIRITEETKEKRMAQSIYNKLKEKNHLNKLRNYADREDDCVKYIQSVNDIIDVLYIAHEGRKFVEHYASKLDELSEESNTNQMTFLILCTFAALGIYEIPISLFINIAGICIPGFDIRCFSDEYKDFLKQSSGAIQLRCSRLMQIVAKEKLRGENLNNWIIKSVNILARNIKEREESPQSELFQKLIKVKSLWKFLQLSKQETRILLLTIEPYCKHLSYYWVQRGILHREMEDFEEANNALSEAASIRNNMSYHIKHAQAKNYLTWGIWAAQHEPTRAAYYFEIGREQIEDLIDNANYRYYSYSTHTFVDMMIRYYKGINEQIHVNDLIKITQLLIRWPDIQEDPLAPTLTKMFLDYCKEIKFNSPELMELEEKYRHKYWDYNKDGKNDFDSDEVDADSD